ncbi:TPA: type VI secretion system baseplate subunit TssK [Escherichia coli]|nr:type VI secretion system-associated protein [Escherichia coli]RCP61027.1 type VI secretion system baseplate subunit TssK [Escherichia coli]HAI0801589.1 type VI secretion system baseplate subunit TssK [Escherichia coli]
MATTRNKVMWQEGMLMRPHHFQQQQRYNDYLDNQRFRAMNDLSWGFTELTLNNELLAQGKIMIDSASGTLPDGTVFSIPDQDALPDPLHPQHFPDERSRNIYLALPVASDVRNEISDGRRIGRYRLNYADVRDLHSEEGDTRTLTLGQLTPRIMSGAEDMSAYITLPLCRISNRHADGSLTLDDDFIPSCQNIQVSKKLRVYLKEVQGAIGGRASDLANRIGSPAQSGIADVAEFMMLQLLNRNQTRFTHRARRSQLHPEDFYLDLAGLLGELMTFTEPSRLPCPLDVYDHHDLTKTFKTLLPEVKRALHTVLSPRAVNLPLHLRDGIWQADIHDTELLQSATFVLAVAANVPVDQIQRQFIQQSKISSPEKIRNMVSVQIPGIPLRALMVAPRQLPYHSGFSYFELDKSGQAWTEMAAAGAVALHVSGSFPDLNMQLWAIRGYPVQQQLLQVNDTAQGAATVWMASPELENYERRLQQLLDTSPVQPLETGMQMMRVADSRWPESLQQQQASTQWNEALKTRAQSSPQLRGWLQTRQDLHAFADLVMQREKEGLTLSYIKNVIWQAERGLGQETPVESLLTQYHDARAQKQNTDALEKQINERLEGVLSRWLLLKNNVMPEAATGTTAEK